MGYSNNYNSKLNTSSAKPSITLDESFTGNYVVITKKAVYSTYEYDRKEIDSIPRGTEVSVTGNSSNGFYRFDYTKEDGSIVDGYLLYKNKDNIVPKEEYDEAWEKTGIVEPHCTKDGYIQYFNDLSELNKKEILAATGHVPGEMIVTKEPTIFSEGIQIVSCEKCEQVLEVEYISPLVPPLMWVMLLVVVIIFIISGIVFIRSKNKQ